MKKLIIICCLIVLFLLPFACDGCDENAPQEYSHTMQVQRGGFQILDLQVNTDTWSFGQYRHRPAEAQSYQLDTESITYKFYYRADSTYLGSDYAEISFYLTGGTLQQRHQIFITVEE